MYYQTTIETPIGEMIAVSDEKHLHLLEFTNRKNLENGLAHFKGTIKKEKAAPLQSIEDELKLFFQGKLKKFQTPIHIDGTPFQKKVWAALLNIPYSKTCSYAELAQAIGQPTAFRAVAQANGRNHFCILIPCHRVINTGGALGGYSSGLERKRWLLELEGAKK
jgi:AraC family transcriptional regulator of adaptative response/methylated-DNA-[protein]-cysteine methyltransferase